MMPAMPGAGLVVVETQFILGGFEAAFNRRASNRSNRAPPSLAMLALTHICCRRTSTCSHQSGLSKVDLPTPVHLAFHQLNLCDLAFGPPIGPRRYDHQP